MAARIDTHPTAESLKAFGLGLLDDASTRTLFLHLDDCPACRRRAEALSGDDFLARLQKARDLNSTTAPSGDTKGVRPPTLPPDLMKTLPPPPGMSIPPESAVPDLPPELADSTQYEVIRELGRGGMGVVYLARNRPMDRLEVLKVVNRGLLERPGTADRFLREIRSAAALEHRNVVRAYACLQSGRLLALVMEYVEGEDLGRLVERRGPLSVASACSSIIQAARGLQKAFSKKMVHRDIKPQNLLLSRKLKEVMILDFGLAKVASEKGIELGLTGDGQMLGTPGYIAPEQIRDAASADIRADIYSLGCTLYFLHTGRPPFEAPNLFALLHAHQFVEARPLDEARPGVPPALAAVVARMMAKDPAARHQTPDEVEAALAPFVKGVTAAPLAIPLMPERKKPKEAAPAAGKAKREAAPVHGHGVSIWAKLDAPEAPPVAPRKSVSLPKPPVRRKWIIGAGVVTAVVLLGLVGLMAGGAFRVKTKDGVLVLENLPEDAEVLVDGGVVQLAMRDGKTAEIRVAATKKHKVQVKTNGFKVFGEEVEIDAGKRRSIVVRLEPLPGPPVKALPASAFVPLFNGKDLTGWQTHPDQPGGWTVEDGNLVGRCGGAAARHLFSERGDFENFHLRIEARINKNGNSGVYFRSEYGVSRGGRFPVGYEAQILHSYPTPNVPLTGSLTGHALVVKPSVEPDEWFTMEVRADGNRIVIKVNGIVTADFVDQKNTHSRGHVTLQAMSDRLVNATTVVEFRKIEIEALPAKPRAGK